MHEMAICCALVEAVGAELARRGGGQVETVRMSIGALQGIEPDLLISAFALLSEDTAMAGAALAITRRPARLQCRTCKGERAADRHFHCASCGGTEVSLLPGKGMTLDEIILRH
ncbi:hydrogenase maturation nickel metallochaperone HypA [Rhodobacter sp. TJ_12]|uniref:hydrogenase maturation nickel metallochaperone HypA/HybF n=1 Tax=Rhodobacter sp. TJ_12 TaxID=2029399 RepID=UPI001CC0CCB5|nr:hydrogenase maturation nickel metallochaperone HypA [Rhodobacter sp. TJ_12]